MGGKFKVRYITSNGSVQHRNVFAKSMGAAATKVRSMGFLDAVDVTAVQLLQPTRLRSRRTG